MRKKDILTIIFIIGILLVSSNTIFAKEITLYDSDGEADAYIDTDDEMTIYLWKGKPVAYLDSDSIYGFNGKHLGWFEDGIIWDHKGYAVGFIKGAVNKFTKFEKFKGFKKFKPFKSFQQLEPIKPIYKSQWSNIPLELFLEIGSK